jgi:hypothetical protein
MRLREARFVDGLFARIVSAFPDVARVPRARVREVIRILAVASLNPAGYGVSIAKTDGRPTKNALKQADYLLNMPRIQKALDDKFTAAGLTMDKAAAIIAEIATAEPQVVKETVDEDGKTVTEYAAPTPADRLRALDMRFRLTTGYAPTRSTAVTTNVPVDAFFDPETFEQTPPIATTTQAPKNVTPPASAPKRKRPR